MKTNTWEADLSRPKLSVHDYSRSVFKLKPKIRIIHIVEPEIIKTTVEDFQKVVQRLTGKSLENRESKDVGNKASSLTLQPKPCSSKPVSKRETAGAPILHETPRMKIEVEEIYETENRTSFLSFLEEVDGFLHDMNEFPQLSFRPSHFNMIEEVPLC